MSVLSKMEKEDYAERIDKFGPISEPTEDYLKLPDDVRLHWVGTEEDIQVLDVLLSEPLIGVDSEWPP